MATLHFPFAGNGSFDPDIIELFNSTFEVAWQSLQANGITFNTAADADTARNMLANCIIKTASLRKRDQNRLRNSALAYLARESRRKGKF